MSSARQEKVVCRARGGAFRGQRWGRGRLPTETMDIADYFKQSSQTAGRRKLWRVPRALFIKKSKTPRGGGGGGGQTSCANHPTRRLHAFTQTALLSSPKNTP